MFKCWLDAGHGEKDAGASEFGIVEKDITLMIAKRINDFLINDYENVEVKMTRTDDVFVSLKQRTDAANLWKADLFVSIHCNASPNHNANGFGSYTYLTANAQIRAAQNVIHRAILEAIPEMKDYGQRQEDFHVLRQSTMPSLLTENGFVTNAQDAKKLHDFDFIKRLAEGHARGIAAVFGLKEKAGKMKMQKDYAGHWAERDIDRAKTLGIMSGYDDGSFKPEKPVTRAELVTVALRLLDRRG